MNSDSWIRVDPDRLPALSRRDYGGGLTMAGTVLLTILFWYGGVFLFVVVRDGAARVTVEPATFVLMANTLFVPLGPLGAFVIGTLLWRYESPAEPTPSWGLKAGAGTALGSLVVGSLGFSAFLGVVGSLHGIVASTEGLVLTSVSTLVFSLLFSVFAIGWLAVPLGALGGWYHERTQRDQADDGSR